jgi:hypothetical protein
MPLFGGKHEEENEALRDEVQRVSLLAPQALAAEVMTKGFGPGGPADHAAAELQNIAGAFNPAESMFGIDDDALVALAQIVAEGVQVLEHACLVRFVFSGGDISRMYWTATRAGQAAIDSGQVEAALGGGTLSA